MPQPEHPLYPAPTQPRVGLKPSYLRSFMLTSSGRLRLASRGVITCEPGSPAPDGPQAAAGATGQARGRRGPRGAAASPRQPRGEGSPFGARGPPSLPEAYHPYQRPASSRRLVALGCCGPGQATSRACRRAAVLDVLDLRSEHFSVPPGARHLLLPLAPSLLLLLLRLRIGAGLGLGLAGVAPLSPCRTTSLGVLDHPPHTHHYRPCTRRACAIHAPAPSRLPYISLYLPISPYVPPAPSWLP